MQLTVNINKKLICNFAVSLARTMLITFSNTGVHIQDIRSIASTQNNWYLAVIAPDTMLYLHMALFTRLFQMLNIAVYLPRPIYFDIHSSQIGLLHSKPYFKSRKFFLRLSISEYQTARLIERSDYICPVTRRRVLSYSAAKT